MYVSQLWIDGIKSFHGTREVNLRLTRPDGSHAGWTVLAGRNGAGKTTLLRALALALSGPAVARGLTQGFDEWLSRGVEDGRVRVEVVPDAAFDRPTAPGGAFRLGLRWTAPQESAPGRRGAQPSMDVLQDGRKVSNALARSGPWSDNPQGWFCAAYGPFRRLEGGSGAAQRLMSAPGPIARQAALFHEDASLAEGVTWLIEQHLRAFERRDGAAALKEVALSTLGDGLLPDGYRIADVDSEGLWVERDGHRYPLREMSDGFRTVSALVVDLLKQIHDAFGDAAFAGPGPLPAPGVVLIDEIDAHLHVTWQRRIGPWLTAHFPNIQFIVTTHSPYICQAADPGGLIRLPGVDEAAAPEVVPEDLYERVIYGSGDDAVLSDLFGLDSPYSEQAERARAELVALEMRIVRGTADESDVHRYEELSDLLTSSPSARVAEVSAALRGLAEEGGRGAGRDR